MSPDGDVKCVGTIKVGVEAGCDTGVCYNRDYFACRSGDKCVKKEKMCHGEPLCEDLSDVEFCNIHNDDVCTTSYGTNFYKCPATNSSEHQECYDPNTDENNSEYNCLSRSDEIDNEENTDNKSIKMEVYNDDIEYESIKPCNVLDLD